MKFTNKADLPIALGLWCASSEYNFKPSAKSISVTSLIKPLRQTLLCRRYPEETSKSDLIEMYAARRGTAIHDSIEKSFLNDEARENYLRDVGWSEEDIRKVVINPEQDNYSSDNINIFLEKRFSKNINGWTISGQTDLVFNGELHDFKTTSVYTYINDSNKDAYILQGSIYRWLAPEYIKSDVIHINYIFTDWSKSKAEASPDYPRYPMMVVPYKLLSVEETEAYIINRLAELEQYENNNLLPMCSKEDLWMSDPVYKYYSQEGKKCLKKFSNKLEATSYLASKGKGFITAEQATPRRCAYCLAYDVCSQKDDYFESDSQPEE